MEREIRTIEEFFDASLQVQEAVENFNNTKKAAYHKALAFRGQTNKNYELMPSIGRGRETSLDISILDQERNLIEMAKYRLPNIFRADLLPIDLLALLQHYGIPTRLLDVTSNPLVALYFAALDDSEDGEVFAFEYNDSDRTNYPIINALAESYKYTFGSIEPLFQFFQSVMEQPYFAEQRNQFIDESDWERELWIKGCCKDLIFVNAAEQSERQRLQQGFYILFPNEICEKHGQLFFRKIIRSVSKDSEQIKARFLIKREGKTTIRKKLEFLGISEATLFADNADIVCKKILDQCNRML